MAASILRLKGQAPKGEVYKSNSTILGLKQFIKGMMNQGMSWEVGYLDSIVSHRKNVFFQFSLLLM